MRYLWLFFTLIKAATFSASESLLAFTGLSGKKIQTKAPIHIVRAPMARKNILQLANFVFAKLTPYAIQPPKILVRALQT
jgi:hypothetical protein